MLKGHFRAHNQATRALPRVLSFLTNSLDDSRATDRSLTTNNQFSARFSATCAAQTCDPNERETCVPLTNVGAAKPLVNLGAQTDDR